MSKSRVLALAALLLAIPGAAPAQFLLDDLGNRLVTGQGERLLDIQLATPLTHQITVINSFGDGIGLTLTLTLNVDPTKTKVTFTGIANAATDPVVSGNLETVDGTPAKNVVILKTCANPTVTNFCVFDLPATSMIAGIANDAWFVALTASGQRYGVTTKISRP